MTAPPCPVPLLLALGLAQPSAVTGPEQPLALAPELGDCASVTLPGGAVLDLVWVPPGSLSMGAANAQDASPPHPVQLSGFWLGVTEVTVGQWRAVMGEPPARNNQGENHPVADVSWLECQAFCSRASLLLPTEAQWEYAARGPEGRTYPWGNVWNAVLCQSWGDRHGSERTLPVGSLRAGRSWCGALDMAGNVYEWCRDWYDEAFYASAASAGPDPECTRSLSGKRVLRGGCWGSSPDNCQTTARSRAKPDFHNAGIGFRVCLAALR